MHNATNIDAKPMPQTAQTWARAVKAGMSIIEMSIVLAVLAIGTTLGINHYTQYINHQVTQSTADHLQMLTEAVSKYTVDQKGDLVTRAKGLNPAVGANGPDPSVFAIVPITKEDLVDKQILRNSDTLVNPFGQTYQILVRVQGADEQKIRLMPFIVSDGNDSMIEPGDAKKVAMALGGTAGYTTVAEPETIVGTNELWRISVDDWGLSAEPERIASAVFYEDGVESIDVSGLLHRKNEGDPVLNTMETDISMMFGTTRSSIRGASEIDALSLVATDVDGSPLTTISAGNIQTTGEVDANSVKAQASLDVGQDATGRTVISAGNVSTTGNVSAIGEISSGGNLSAGNYVEVKGVATEGDPCSPDGLIGRTESGLLLSCQSGMWKKAGLALAGKETNSGPVGGYFTYVGYNAGEALTYYCLDRTIEYPSTSMVIVSLLAEAASDAAAISHLSTSISLNGTVVAQNNTVAEYSGGGFSTSAATSEILTPSQHTLRLCTAARNLNGFWNIRYSISNVI